MSKLKLDWVGSMLGADVIDGIEYNSVELQHLISCWRARSLVKYQGLDDGSTALKVLAYVIRGQPENAQILVFEHADFPSAGIQVPAGTIDPGEAPEVAVRRELNEETGIVDAELLSRIDVYEWENPSTGRWHRRHVYEFKIALTTPDRWMHTVSSGKGDQGLRFDCYWLPLNHAIGRLAGDQDYSLHRLRSCRIP